MAKYEHPLFFFLNRHYCRCLSGFRSYRDPAAPGSVRCADVDECADGTHTCGGNAACENTLGSYACKCEGEECSKGNGTLSD